MHRRARALAVVLTMVGCAGGGDPDDAAIVKGSGRRPTEAADEPDLVADLGTIAALTAAPAGATISNWEATRSAGAVEILTPQGGCSGVMVGASMILTIGHCWHDGTDSGYMMARIHLALDDGRWRCLTGPDEHPDGKCVYQTRLSFERYDATQEPTAARDFMAIFPEELGGRWWGDVAHLAAAGLWSGQLAEPQIAGSMALFGRGFTSEAGEGLGVMRSAYFSMPYVTATSGAITYRSLGARDAMPCGGDSGGPLEDTYALGWVVGLHSGRKPPLDLRCGTSQQTFHATKITQNKMRWLNDRRRYNGLDDCWTAASPDSWLCH